ncbi:hypothetical protein JCM10213_003633 [Rhodosporidiobolus nylandii]
MSALEWAQAVLSLASGSQTPPSQTELPASPAELVRAWVDQLDDPETTVEEKEVVLRALRCCRFSEGFDLILRAAAPLLLDFSPSLRLQAAGCILQYLSASPADLLCTLTSPLLTSVTRALAPLQFQLPSAPSSTLPRLASTLLRMLNALALKLPSLSAEHTATLCTNLSTWIHYGRTSPTGGVSPALSVSRGRVPEQGQLAFGVMSAFAQPPASPRRRVRAGSQVERQADSRASSLGRGESGSEDESGVRDRRRDAAQIRLDALTCLRTLASNDAKSLHKHWALFLSDSPYLRNRPTLFSLIENDPSRSVRLQACAVLNTMLEGSTSYLAIAEDRPSKASFTSLSSSVGETVSEMHLCLSALLALPLAAGKTDERLVLLDLAAKLAANAPYGRMKRPLARGLAKALMGFLDSPDPALSAAAAACLSIVAARYISTGSSQPFEWTELLAIAKPLLHEGRPEEVQRAGWTLLSAIVPAVPEHDWSATLSRLDQHFTHASPALQQAQTCFLVALFRPSPSSSASPAGPFTPPPLAVPLLQRSLASPAPSVRLRACGALSFPSLALPPSSFDAWQASLNASSDSCAAVRAAAVRAIGLLAKSQGGVPQNRLVAGVQVLAGQLDCEEGEAGAAWALANCCDAITDSDIAEVDRLRLVERVTALLEQPGSNEQTRTSCFRIYASLFKLAPDTALVQVDVASRVVDAVQAGLAAPAAKVRWNAAIASSSIIPRLLYTFGPSHATTLTATLTSLLLTDTSFKARIHAVGALSVVPPASLLADVIEQVRSAKERLQREIDEGKVPVKEKAHAEILMKRLDAYLARAASAPPPPA